MQYDIGGHDLLQCRAESLNQLGRQEADETDGVGEHHGPTVGELGTPGSGVQGGEQGVLHQHTRPCQGVEQ